MNVWFGDHHQRVRWTELFRLLENLGPDVIAFQEVTAAFVEQLSNEAWVAPYQWVDDGGPGLGQYGVAVLSRIPIVSAGLVPLPSNMGRSLLHIDVEAGDRLFTIATAHLESYQKNAECRAQQLETIREALRDSPHGVLCGDLNFCATWQVENDRLDRRYQDLWSELRPDEAGFTVDPGRNRMLSDDSMPPVRFDRILLFSAGSYWRGTSIDMIGTESLPGLPTLYPSEHFGLVATLARR